MRNSLSRTIHYALLYRNGSALQLQTNSYGSIRRWSSFIWGSSGVGRLHHVELSVFLRTCVERQIKLALVDFMYANLFLICEIEQCATETNRIVTFLSTLAISHCKFTAARSSKTSIDNNDKRISGIRRRGRARNRTPKAIDRNSIHPQKTQHDST